MKLWVEITGEMDTLMLWSLIERYNLNLTEVIGKCWVYGDCNYTIAGKVIAKCALFGDITAKITRGDANEQEETER